MSTMDSVTSRLPAVLGSFAALIVTFISFLAQVSPLTCVMRAATAFMVFSAFGIVIRYLLGSGAQEPGGETPEYREAHLEDIAPGTPVGELLGGAEQTHSEDAA